MTDAPHNDDERDELVSAYLDGAASDAERALVEGDGELRGRLDELARVRAAVQAPEVAPTGAQRDAAVAAALAAAAEPGGVLADPAPAAGTEAAPAAVPLARRRRPERRVRYLAAVAAAVAAVALAVPLLSNLDSGDDDAGSMALDATEERASGDGAAPVDDHAGDAVEGSDAEIASALADTDLGAHPDLDALAAAAAARVEGAGAATTLEGNELGATTTTAAACAGQLALPAGAEVVLDATATVDGVPVVVVVHRVPDGDPQLVVARAEDCEVLSARPL